MGSLGRVKSAVKWCLDFAFSEPTITESATYKLLSGRAHDGLKKRTVLSYTDSSVTLLNVKKMQEVQHISPVGTELQVESVDYIIMTSSLPTGHSTKDKIQIGSSLYSIKDRRSYIGIAYGLVLEHS